MVILGNHLRYDRIMSPILEYLIITANLESDKCVHNNKRSVYNHQKTKKITDLVVEPFQIGRCYY